MAQIVGTPTGQKPARYDKKDHNPPGLDTVLDQLETGRGITDVNRRQKVHDALKHVDAASLQATSSALKSNESTRHIGLSMEHYLASHRMGDLGSARHKRLSKSVRAARETEPRMRDYARTLQDNITWIE